MWDWITLFHFNDVFSIEMTGYSEHRYILNQDWFVRNRHLIRTPWYAVNTYGESSKLFLSKAPYVGSDYLETYFMSEVFWLRDINDNSCKYEVRDYKPKRAMEQVYKIEMYNHTHKNK